MSTLVSHQSHTRSSGKDIESGNLNMVRSVRVDPWLPITSCCLAGPEYTPFLQYPKLLKGVLCTQLAHKYYNALSQYVMLLLVRLDFILCTAYNFVV